MQTRIGDALAIVAVFILAASHAITGVLGDFDTFVVFADLIVFAFELGAGIFHTFTIFAGGAAVALDVGTGFHTLSFSAEIAALASHTGARIRDTLAFFTTLPIGTTDGGTIVVGRFGNTLAFDTNFSIFA